MKHRKLKVGELLEQYVYKVTLKVIAIVDSKTQTSLIKLFNSINTEQPPEAQKSKAEVKAIERLIVIRQLTIETTLTYISRVDVLLEKAKHTIPNTARNIALIARYLSLKNKYSVALISVQALQQKDINSIANQ